jgi:lipoprotein-anchoring transpeptidase ErfK/SrfK
VSKHRAGSAPKQRLRDGSHRAEVRPRYGRIVTLVASLAVTVVAAVGGAGLLPSSAGDADPASAIERASDDQGDRETGTARGRLTATPDTDTDTDDGGDEPATPNRATDPSDRSLPAGSGEGRRIVFSQSRQRVWLVDDEVERTYLVSGSVYDNLDPGTFEVYSRSEDAVGIDDSGTMQYFVRFTTGDEGAAIGFHDIPIDEGEPVQTLADLGTPLSHGCIRQKTEDAIALWDFAPVGTTVVVTA